MIDLLLFGVFPYVAVILAVAVSLWRFKTREFTFTSLSSQFLEGRQLFWGSVPWHYGILLLLLGHLIGILFPSGVQAFNGVPLRLYILEGTALALGLLALVGLVVLFIRRSANPYVQVVTSPMDMVLLLALLFQVVTGVGTAILYRWGSAWFVSVEVPWLWSLATLTPNWSYMVSLPLLAKLHAVGVFALVALLPFTRLIHIVSAPLPYLWRPYQVVMWYRQRQAIQASTVPSASNVRRDGTPSLGEPTPGQSQPV
ncbi:MAG: respiratory nitrate reductase subunit gamma [Chloroflexota bacterium]|nr:MAG: respiratory nitrate reductase subunit gamma [Chloroflexota bacterium]